MAYNEKMTNKVRAALAHLPNTEEKKMFRGIAFMVEGKMCISVGDDRMMCRIDPALHDAAIEKNGCRPVEMKGRIYRGYVYISEASMKAKKDFDYWIGMALDFNKKAKASPKKKKR
jgi:TfoX/Sxy family transcriptional regulator of competence genes